jgi:xylulokinase
VLGAAILAGVGTGLFGSIKEAAGALVAIDRSFEPDASLSARYNYAYGKYRELYGQLEAFNAELVAHSS